MLDRKVYCVIKRTSYATNRNSTVDESPFGDICCVSQDIGPSSCSWGDLEKLL